MPIIDISQDWLDKGKDPVPGWSYGKLKNIAEFAAKTGDSTNYLFEFEIETGPEASDTNKGRTQSVLFNSKILGLDGSKGFTDVKDLFKTMVASLQGLGVNEFKPDKYELDELKEHSCFFKIITDVDQNGKLITKITDFSSHNNVPF